MSETNGVTAGYREELTRACGHTETLALDADDEHLELRRQRFQAKPCSECIRLAVDQSQQLQVRRSALSARLIDLQAEIASSPKGSRKREQKIGEQRATQKELILIKGELASLWDAAKRAPRPPSAAEVLEGPPPPNPKPHSQRVFLDEYDLRNALVEPQTLLHRAYNVLLRALSVAGKREGDTDLLDPVKDYLQRCVRLMP